MGTMSPVVYPSSSCKRKFIFIFTCIVGVCYFGPYVNFHKYNYLVHNYGHKFHTFSFLGLNILKVFGWWSSTFLWTSYFMNVFMVGHSSLSLFAAFWALIFWCLLIHGFDFTYLWISKCLSVWVFASPWFGLHLVRDFDHLPSVKIIIACMLCFIYHLLTSVCGRCLFLPLMFLFLPWGFI